MPDDRLLFYGVLPFPPSANKLWMVARGKRRITPTAEAVRFKALVGDVVFRWMERHGLPASGDEAYRGEVEVQLLVFRPNRRYDLDNCIKASIDGMKKRIIFDDNQVVRIVAEAQLDKLNPRAEMWVYRLDEEIK